MSVGGNFKVIHRKGGDFAKSWGFGIDAGAQYQSKKEWKFGAVFRDVTSTFNAWIFTLNDETKEVFLNTGNAIPENGLELTLPRLILGGYKKFDLGSKGIYAAAELDVDFKEGKLLVGVKNVGAGHHLPTGVADFRELWLDVTLKDADGNIVLSSGKLNEDGNLGEDARMFMKVFGDDNGEPVGLLFWKYTKLLSDTRIPAGERRVEAYDIKTRDALKYPITATVKLNFRIYPQWVTDAVSKLFPHLPNPTVVSHEQINKRITR